jgi:polyisoprenoid-binding protein YceI
MNKLLNVLFIFFVLIAASQANAQDKLISKSGRIDFNADGGHIKAITRSANVLLDKKTGEINFLVLIKGFEFAQAGMQEKFNEQVLESETYPSSSFKGTLVNIHMIDFSKPGKFTGIVKGILSMHGVQQSIETDYSLKVDKAGVTVSCKFNLNMSDYKIKSPVDGDEVVINIQCVLEEVK